MARGVRQIRRTLHVTVEGSAEQLLALALKGRLTSGQRGPSTTIHNARGKGALNVIKTSLRCAPRRSFNVRVVVLDTDTDWDERAEKAARQGGVLVFAMQPCLEAVLLRAKGFPAPETTARCKESFLKNFGGPAHDHRVQERHFGAEFLEDACGSCELGKRILALFG